MLRKKLRKIKKKKVKSEKNIVREKCVNCAPWCRTLAPESFKPPSLCILYTAGLNLPKNIYKYIYIYTQLAS